MATVILHWQQQVNNYDPVLANNSWAQIAKASAAGKASTLWSVEDTKDIIVAGETLTLSIMDFDHDELASGGKAGITFGMRNLMREARFMHTPTMNRVGFTGSNMYEWLHDTVLKSLAPDLQAVIKTVNKETSAGNQSLVINTDPMKLFLFSEQEIFGEKYKSVGNEGTQYSYFKPSKNRIKRCANGGTSEDNWWQRSPSRINTVSYCHVTILGNANANGSQNKYGVCFGFCV